MSRSSETSNTFTTCPFPDADRGVREHRQVECGSATWAIAACQIAAIVLMSASPRESVGPDGAPSGGTVELRVSVSTDK